MSNKERLITISSIALLLASAVFYMYRTIAVSDLNDLTVFPSNYHILEPDYFEFGDDPEYSESIRLGSRSRTTYLYFGDICGTCGRHEMFVALGSYDTTSTSIVLASSYTWRDVENVKYNFNLSGFKVGKANVSFETVPAISAALINPNIVPYVTVFDSYVEKSGLLDRRRLTPLDLE